MFFMLTTRFIFESIYSTINLLITTDYFTLSGLVKYIFEITGKVNKLKLL